MRTLLPKLVVFLCPLYLVGCSVLYVPDSRNTIIFEEAGEFHADVNYGTNGFEIKSAFSITDFLGMGYSGSFINRTYDILYFKPHSHSYHEFMGLVNIKRFASYGRLNLTAGYGAGTSTAYDEYVQPSGNELTLEGDFNRFFIQPTVALKKEKITYGLANRFSYVNFSSFSSSLPQDGNSYNGYYFEPAIFIRSVGDKFGFISQFGLSVGLDDVNANVFNHEIYQISVGLNINLAEVFKRSDTK
ncbi:MAG: hypothetical protein WD022_09705 [Balneolaceae bacterium]